MEYIVLEIDDIEDVLKKNYVIYCHKEILKKAFDDPNKIDNLDYWISKINKHPKNWFLFIIFDKNKVPIAILVAEKFIFSKSILISYVVVKPIFQGKNLPSLLFDSLKKITPGEYTYFSEIERYSEKKINKKRILARQKWICRMGFSHIPINYIQPPIYEGYDYVYDMNLFYYPSRKEIKRGEIIDFLKEYYESLGLSKTESLKTIKASFEGPFIGLS